MAQWEMALAAKPKDLSSIPLIHAVEGGSCPLTSKQDVSASPCLPPLSIHKLCF